MGNDTGGFFLDVICECTYNLVLTNSEATKLVSSMDEQLIIIIMNNNNSQGALI